MKKCNYLILITCSICLITFNSAYSQIVKTDSAGLLVALNNAKSHFYNAVGEESPLYNGTEYYFYNPQTIRGSAYFLEAKATVQGNVYYDGGEYKNIELLYDLNKDELVTVLYNHYSYYTLAKGLVQNFDLMDHHFVNINTDTLINNTVIKSGYYDELYNNKSQVLVRREKQIQNTTTTTGAPDAYSYFTDPSQQFFIRKDNVYYKISGEGSLLDVFKDKKKQLQQYIRANKIKFRNDQGQAMVSIASYYDHLSN